MVVEGIFGLLVMARQRMDKHPDLGVIAQNYVASTSPERPPNQDDELPWSWECIP